MGRPHLNRVEPDAGIPIAQETRYGVLKHEERYNGADWTKVVVP